LPDQIQDNLSADWTADIRAYADANNIELFATPTYASYLNRIECRFLPISELVVKNADYLDWDAFAHALAGMSRTATRTPQPTPSRCHDQQPRAPRRGEPRGRGRCSPHSGE